MKVDLSNKAKLFLGLVTFLFLFTASLTIWRIVTLIPVNGVTQNVVDLIFAAVLLVNLFFFAFHAINGVVHELPESLMAFAFAAIMLTFYELWRFISKCVENSSFTGLEVTDYLRFFSVIVFSPLSLALAFLVFREFGWHDYKVVGADPDMQRIYRDYHRFFTMMIIDFQVGVTLATFSIVSFYAIPESKIFDIFDIISFILYLLLSIGWIFLGYYAVRLERKYMMTIFFILALGEPAYIGYSFWKFLSNDSFDEYFQIVKPLLVIGVGAIIVRLAVIGLAARCLLNFNKGLLFIFNKDKALNEIEPNENTPIVNSVYSRLQYDPTAVV